MLEASGGFAGFKLQDLCSVETNTSWTKLGQVRKFHQARFPWKKWDFPKPQLPKLRAQVVTEIAIIIWPDQSFGTSFDRLFNPKTPLPSQGLHWTHHSDSENGHRYLEAKQAMKLAPKKKREFFKWIVQTQIEQIYNDI